MCYILYHASIQHVQLSLVVEKRLVGLHFKAKILNYRGSNWEERQPEEYFMEGLYAYFSPGILSAPAPLSHSLLRPSVLLEWCTFVHPVTSLPLFPHLFSLLSVPSSALPPPPSHSLNDFKWLQGKLFGVQVKFRHRPNSLSLYSPRLSRHVTVCPGILLPWDWPLCSKPRNSNGNSVPLWLGLWVDQMGCTIDVWHWTHLCLMPFSLNF